MTFEPSLAAPQALGALKGTHLRRPLPRSGAAPGLLTHKGINREDAIVHDAGVPGGPFGPIMAYFVPSGPCHLLSFGLSPPTTTQDISVALLGQRFLRFVDVCKFGLVVSEQPWSNNNVERREDEGKREETPTTPGRAFRPRPNPLGTCTTTLGGLPPPQIPRKNVWHFWRPGVLTSRRQCVKASIARRLGV